MSATSSSPSPARGLEIEHEDLGLQQRGLHPLAFAGNIALQEGGEDADRAKKSGSKIGDGDADPHRPAARRAGNGHEATHALRNLVEAGPLVVRAILAEAGNAAVDDARVDLAHALIVDAELGFHVGSKVLDDDVGLPGQPHEHFQALGVFQVQRDGAFVAVQILEVRAVARAARLLAGGVLQQRIDLDDIGAPIRELAHTGRPGADAGEVEHRETGEGFGSAWEGH